MTRWLALLSLALIALSPGALAEELTLPQTVEAQRALIELRPGDASLHNDLGNLLLVIGDEAAAEAAYREALAIDPDLAAAHFNLGLLYQQTLRKGKAQHEFERTTTLQPDHAWAHYQLGVLHSLQGRRSAAIKSYARAFRLDPRLTDPAFNPHILDNDVAPSATLAAYADVSSADLVPRTYESPRRIAGLMVPLPPHATEGIESEALAEGGERSPAADGYEDEMAPTADNVGPSGEEIKAVPQEPLPDKPRRARKKTQ